MLTYQPDGVSAPAETLAETLEALGMTQAEFAERTDRQYLDATVRRIDDPPALASVGSSRTPVPFNVTEESVSNTAWLRCEVTPGMFENEVAVSVRTADGLVLSFFLPADLVKSLSKEHEEKAISVEVVDRSAEYGVVALPRRTFEGTNVARVPARALVFA